MLNESTMCNKFIKWSAQYLLLWMASDTCPTSRGYAGLTAAGGQSIQVRRSKL